jgi:hypothetical protein
MLFSTEFVERREIPEHDSDPAIRENGLSRCAFRLQKLIPPFSDADSIETSRSLSLMPAMMMRMMFSRSLYYDVICAMSKHRMNQSLIQYVPRESTYLYIDRRRLLWGGGGRLDTGFAQFRHVHDSLTILYSRTHASRAFYDSTVYIIYTRES